MKKIIIYVLLLAVSARSYAQEESGFFGNLWQSIKDSIAFVVQKTKQFFSSGSQSPQQAPQTSQVIRESTNTFNQPDLISQTQDLQDLTQEEKELLEDLAAFNENELNGLHNPLMNKEELENDAVNTASETTEKDLADMMQELEFELDESPSAPSPNKPYVEKQPSSAILTPENIQHEKPVEQGSQEEQKLLDELESLSQQED